LSPRFSPRRGKIKAGEHCSPAVKKVTEPEPGVIYPRCVDGERACPPEDVGGVYGFAGYVEAITNPNHSEYGELLEWNGPFDPAQFDAAKATRRMKKGLPTW
jgi:hypothetical protein